MITESVPQIVTRREALQLTLKAGLAATTIIAAASEPPTSEPPTPFSEAEFVPEHDYPYFGAEPEHHARR